MATPPQPKTQSLEAAMSAYLRTLEALCADGYLAIEELIPVPPDCTGYPETRVRPPLVDPAPFNHSTQIAVLRVRRKEK